MMLGTCRRPHLSLHHRVDVGLSLTVISEFKVWSRTDRLEGLVATMPPGSHGAAAEDEQHVVGEPLPLPGDHNGDGDLDRPWSNRTHEGLSQICGQCGEGPHNGECAFDLCTWCWRSHRPRAWGEDCPMPCFRCHQLGHSVDSCPHHDKWCSHCDRTGHWVVTCPYREYDDCLPFPKCPDCLNRHVPGRCPMPCSRCHQLCQCHVTPFCTSCGKRGHVAAKCIIPCNKCGACGHATYRCPATCSWCGLIHPADERDCRVEMAAAMAICGYCGLVHQDVECPHYGHATLDDPPRPTSQPQLPEEE